MKKYSWKEIINSDLDSIKLIGYGSIINKNSHKGKTECLEAVITKGFKRIYNIKYLPDNFRESNLDIILDYSKKYGINSEEELFELNKNNTCVLNSIYTGNKEDYINGLLVEVKKESFLYYAKRENQYCLYKTHYCVICPKDGTLLCDKKTNIGYVLVAQDKFLLKDGTPFLPYHDNVVLGAYELGDYFGEIFKKTTYNLNNKLVH